MIWINKINVLFVITTTLIGSTITVRESYNILNSNSGLIHATPHITNIIRNSPNNLTEAEKDGLQNIGLEVINGQIQSIFPNDLDQIYDTDHFRFHFTFEGNDAVANIEYIISMAQIYEQVYLFFTDTLGFDYPPSNPAADNNLYQIYVENLPPYYFGITYTTNANISDPACVSYIRMRNNYSASQFSDHTELDNIKVTAVHEFFHSIQFGYNCYERLWFMEATAVWSEDELYNGINDLYRYMPSWFSNPNKPIDDESGHMYGTFIYFQYIDEHLGGPETIKSCWENSNSLASPIKDISFDAINTALTEYNASFDDAYKRMRIANKILSTDAGIYSYAEAEGYKSIVSGPPEEYVSFQKGNDETISSQIPGIYKSNYYSLSISSPVKIQLKPLDGGLLLSSILKHKNKNQWTVRSTNEINIDSEIKIEWISLIVSVLGEEITSGDYTLEFSDGYSEDFAFQAPYPNPSFGKPISIDLQVINEQTIYTNIFDIMGKNIWTSSNQFSESESTTLLWNGTNNFGKKVANGLYIIIAKGSHKETAHKIIIIK